MTSVLFCLAGRLLGSVTASVLQKRLLSVGMGTGRLWLVTYGCLLAPAVAILAASRGTAGPEFWTAALLAALLDVAGNVAMASALRDTDLSIFGPLNAFRPALAWIAGWWFLGEHPTATGIAGVIILTLGALWLLRPNPAAGGPDEGAGHLRAAAWRLAGLALSTAGAVFLKRATLAGSVETTLGVWIIGGWLATLLLWFASQRSLRVLWTRAVPGSLATVGLHATVFLIMQWLTLEVFRRTLLTYSFAFFQMGMVLQVLIGRWVLREAEFRKRLIACLVMGSGALLVLIGG
ncbi:MAG: EamA family transporter [Verrucomicrobiales bacterium]|nr:EamA family transporter [Verrucomicrobiales bacterium]